MTEGSGNFASMISCRCSVLKLETPIALALPAFQSVMRAFHVLRRHCLALYCAPVIWQTGSVEFLDEVGQCISSRSTYVVIVSSR